MWISKSFVLDGICWWARVDEGIRGARCGACLHSVSRDLLLGGKKARLGEKMTDGGIK